MAQKKVRGPSQISQKVQMEEKELLDLIHYHHEQALKLSQELRLKRTERAGFQEVSESDIRNLVQKGDVYELEGATQSFVLIRNGEVVRVSVSAGDKWTHIQVGPYVHDWQYGAFVRKVSDTRAELVRFMSALTLSEFKGA